MINRIRSLFGALGASLLSIARYGSPDDTPGGLWWCRWQNLTKDDKRGEFPLHGRAWLSFAPDGASKFRFEWVLGRDAGVRFGVQVDSDEPDLLFRAALPPIAVYLGFESPRLYSLFKALNLHHPREIAVSAHDGAVWWSAWMNPHLWGSSDSRWRRGAFNVADAIFGKQTVEREILKENVPVKIPMPEGVYEGKCTMILVKVARPRWFAEHARRASIELSTPIPVPGKGENSWDCGDDAISGLEAPARSIAEGVANVTRAALRQRERYASRDWVPASPAPIPAAQA